MMWMPFLSFILHKAIHFVPLPVSLSFSCSLCNEVTINHRSDMNEDLLYEDRLHLMHIIRYNRVIHYIIQYFFDMRHYNVFIR